MAREARSKPYRQLVLWTLGFGAWLSIIVPSASAQVSLTLSESSVQHPASVFATIELTRIGGSTRATMTATQNGSLVSFPAITLQVPPIGPPTVSRTVIIRTTQNVDSATSVVLRVAGEACLGPNIGACPDIISFSDEQTLTVRPQDPPPVCLPKEDAACRLRVDVSPVFPQLGDTVSLRPNVSGGPGGLPAFEWTVTGPNGRSIEVSLDDSPESPSPSDVIFSPEDAGLHRVRARISFCDGERIRSICDDELFINVRPRPSFPFPFIPSTRMRFHYVPSAAHQAVLQDDRIPVDVWASVDEIHIGTRTLDSGVLVSGTVNGPTGGIKALVRISPRATAMPVVEAFSGADGVYSTRVPSPLPFDNGPYDVMIVPEDSSLPSMRFVEQTPADLNGAYQLTQGDTATARVFEADGVPADGAVVAWGTGDLIGTIVTTDPTGQATGFLRTGEGKLSLDVVLPDASPSPDLTLAGDVFLSPGVLLDVRASSLPTVTLEGTLRRADGSLYSNGKVLFVTSGPLPNAGTLSVDGGPTISLLGQVRQQANADDAGRVSVALPRGKYDVVVLPTAEVDPQEEGIGVFALDLSGGSPAPSPTWSMAPVVSSDVNVSVFFGNVVEGVRIVATTRGVHGRGQGGAQAITDSAGNAALRLVDGLSYDVMIDPPPDQPLGRVYTSLMGGSSSLEVALVRAVTLRGTLQLATGERPPGIGVRAFCTECGTGQVPGRPMGESVSGPAGEIAVRVPAPSIFAPVITVVP